MIINAGRGETLLVAIDEILTVVAGVASTGAAVRKGNSAGEADLDVTDIAASTTVTFGPYTVTARFAINCITGSLTVSTARQDLTAINQTSGSVELAPDYSDSNSFQPIAADLNLEAGAGTSTSGDTAFLAAMMGNVIGDTLTKTHNYLAGIIAACSVLGARGSSLPIGGMLAIIMDGVSDIDGIVVAHIDGSDPSASTRARAAFAVSIANNHASSGVDYGVDLKYVPDSVVNTLLSGTAKSFAITKGLLRSPNNVVILESADVPVDGTTGDNFAGKGSICIDYGHGEAYINTGTITDSVWKKITHAA